jgi:hypothetical protein
MLIVPARFIEKGWISRGLVREDTKLADTSYVLGAWEGEVGIKDEIGYFLGFLTAPCPPLIPTIKPTMIHSDCFPSRSLSIAQALDQ